MTIRKRRCQHKRAECLLEGFRAFPLLFLIESEAEEMLSNGQNPHAKRILDACDKLFRWGSATRGHLTEEQRERLNAMSLDDVIAALI